MCIRDRVYSDIRTYYTVLQYIADQRQEILEMCSHKMQQRYTLFTCELYIPVDQSSGYVLHIKGTTELSSFRDFQSQELLPPVCGRRWKFTIGPSAQKKVQDSDD